MKRLTLALTLAFTLSALADILPAQSFRYIVRVSGAANTGTATAADVAAGKTFSSATVTNGTGTNTKNASVDAGSAPILPVQAYVDNIGQFGFPYTGTVSLSGKGITHIDPALVSAYDFARQKLVDGSIRGAGASFDFSNNALSEDEVNAILAALVADGTGSGAIDLSGGTNAAPTGQGLDDAQTLLNGMWSVATN
jgi:hypothetical protein